MAPPEADPDARTLCDAFQATARRSPDEIALGSADTGASMTWLQYSDRVRRIAAGLASLGVRRGAAVALMLTNRIEFFPCDTATLHLGATPFSVYNTFSPEQIAYVFSDARNEVVITEKQFVDRVKRAAAIGPAPTHIVCVDADEDGVVTLDALERRDGPDFDFESSWRAVDPNDPVTLIYTSGTTGPPKGVELTHANLLAQCRAVAEVLPMRAGARITSYLPSAHAADRWSSHYNQMVYGFQVTTVADPRTIGAVLQEVRPTVWGGVPRIFEKLVAGLLAAIDSEPDAQRREALRRAIDVSLERVRLLDAGELVPEHLQRSYEQLDAQLLSRLREKLGLDQAEWIICGAAPLSRHVHEMLLALGLPVVELYGMSECTCVVTVCHPAEAKIGTVGKALPGVEVRLADDGELLVRGPIVMRGYHADPVRTAEVLDGDGWLHSGDIAEIDAGGYLKIVDRKKELIINAAGKNMSPANIEEKLKSASPLIGQAVCIGDGRRYNVALLVLDPDAVSAYAREHRIVGELPAALAEYEPLLRELDEAVGRANAQLSRVEQIKRFHVLADEWAAGGDELTPTMKLKRKPIAEKYAGVIEELYAQPAGLASAP
jgi:long-subunit acyl-CoA synthetase (AMP-forming)